MIENIKYDDLLVRHWILFDYDVKDAYAIEPVHYVFKIKDSIHYKALLSGDYSDYVTLIETSKQHEHSLKSFLFLKENFDIDMLNENKIHVRWDDRYNKYIVWDGVHRLALLLYNMQNLNPNWFKLN